MVLIATKLFKWISTVFNDFHDLLYTFCVFLNAKHAAFFVDSPFTFLHGWVSSSAYATSTQANTGHNWYDCTQTTMATCP